MKYFNGKESMEDKYNQIHNNAKPGPNRTMSIKNNFFLRKTTFSFHSVLVFLKHLYHKIISTRILFFSARAGGIYLLADTKRNYWILSSMFKKILQKIVRCIIDCTEIQIDRTSLASSNNEVYSQYKSRPTLKCLVGITPVLFLMFPRH